MDVKKRPLTRGRNFEFDGDKTVQYMVASKLVDPSSQLKSTGIQLQHLYRSLDFLLESKDDVLKWINRKLLVDHGREFEGDETVSGVDFIMKAVKLTLLTGHSDRSVLARCLDSRFRTDDEVYMRKK